MAQEHHQHSQESEEPSVEPVTLTEAKAHLRVDHTDDDDLINLLIKAAREHAEAYTRRVFVQRQFTTYLNDWPDEYIELLAFPLVSVTSVEYLDDDGASQTLASSQYDVDSAIEPGRIYRAYDITWPDITERFHAVTVTYEAGYASTSSPTDLRENIPSAIKQAILLLVGHLYENRESVIVGTTAIETPMAYKTLLSPYKSWRL